MFFRTSYRTKWRQLLRLATGRGLSNGPSFNGSPYPLYALLDLFTTDRSAGAVNGTAAEPGPGTRTVTDTNSKLSVSGGVASFATGGVGAGDPGLWYASQARLFGRTLIGTVTWTTSGAGFGWDTDQAGENLDGIRFSGATLQVRVGGGTVAVGANLLGTAYQLCLVMRLAGYYFFIKGGAFTNWTMLWQSVTTSASVFPSAVALNSTSVLTADNIRVPVPLYTVPVLAYCTFS